MRYLLIFTALVVSMVLPLSAYATIGVGVGTGKIQVEDKLKPGIIYDLPPLTVVNTGDEPSAYEVTVTYHENQTQLRPDANWFIFEPQKFNLEPGKVQVVKTQLNIPVSVQPGDYFGYLEAHPAKTNQSESTSVGIAAASKLYFSVVPANLFQGIYYKGLSLWRVYTPWPQRILLIAGVVLAYTILKRFLNIEINVKKPANKSVQKQTEEDTE